MDAATVFRVLSLIPDRIAYASSGAACPAAAKCEYPERLAFILQRQHWLSPILEALNKEEQRMLGLHAAHGRPALESGEDAAEPGEAADLEEAELELDAEE